MAAVAAAATLSAPGAAAAAPPATRISAFVTAGGDLVRTFGWTIAQSVSPPTLTLPQTASGTVQSTLAVTRNAGALSGDVAGQVCVQNQGAAPTQGLSISLGLHRVGSAAVLAATTMPIGAQLASRGFGCYSYQLAVPSALAAPLALFEVSATVNITNNADPKALTESTLALLPLFASAKDASVHVSDSSGRVFSFNSSGSKISSTTYSCDQDQGTHTATATIAETGQTSSATVDVLCQDPDLTIAATHAPTTFQADSGGVYTLTVTNNGTASTSGTVSVLDELPAGLTATGMSGPGWSCSTTTGQCTRTDSLPAGRRYPPVQISVSVEPSAPAQVTNIATVTGGGDLTPANDQAQDLTTIASGFDLAVTITDNSSSVVPGTTIHYTVVVTNSGRPTPRGDALGSGAAGHVGKLVGGLAQRGSISVGNFRRGQPRSSYGPARRIERDLPHRRVRGR